MQLSFTAAQTLTRHFLIINARADADPALIAKRLLGSQNGMRAEGVIFYECEELQNSAKIFGATTYNEKGEKLPLTADGARALAAYLWKSDPSLSKNLRILSEGEIKSVTEKTEEPPNFAVSLPPPSFDAKNVGLALKTPLLGQKLFIGNNAYPFYALSFGNSSYAVCFRFGVPLAELRPASIALPLSVKHIFTRTFDTVFVEVTGDDSLSLRVFSIEHGEVNASSEGAAAAVAASHLLGLLPIANDLYAKMRGGALCLRADYLGAPITASAEVRLCFQGSTDLF